MQIKNSTLCEDCQHLQSMSGDWVDYGSTKVQLPETWECMAEWTEGNEANDYCNDQIEQTMNNERHDCPHFKELPRCPKHPDSLMDKRYGCGACEQEQEKRYVELLKQGGK